MPLLRLWIHGNPHSTESGFPCRDLHDYVHRNCLLNNETSLYLILFCNVNAASIADTCNGCFYAWYVFPAEWSFLSILTLIQEERNLLDEVFLFALTHNRRFWIPENFWCTSKHHHTLLKSLDGTGIRTCDPPFMFVDRSIKQLGHCGPYSIFAL